MSDTVTVPTCSCGIRMVELERHPGLFQCAHCDGPCHKRCNDDAGCDRGDGKCHRCNAFDIGSRKKKLAAWHPPRVA